MSDRVGTQDKARARRLKGEAARLAAAFLESTDTGDRADRIGPDLAETIRKIATIEGWRG